MKIQLNFIKKSQSLISIKFINYKYIKTNINILNKYKYIKQI